MVRCVAVNASRESHHQRRGEHLRQRTAVAHLVEHGRPHVLARGPRQVVSEVVARQVVEHHRSSRRQHVRALDRVPVLVHTAREQQRQSGGVQRVERRSVQPGGDLVEPVQHRQDPLGVHQRRRQRPTARPRRPEERVGADELLGHPVAQPGASRMPRTQPEDHRHRPVPREVQHEPRGQDRLPGSGTSQHDQPPGADPAVDLDDLVEATGQLGLTTDVEPAVPQVPRRVVPGHGQRHRIVDLPLLLLAAPPGLDRGPQRLRGLGQRVEPHRLDLDGLVTSGGGEQLGPLGPGQLQRVRQRPHGAHARIGPFTGLQPANSPDAHSRALGERFLAQSRPLPPLTQQHAELARHTVPLVPR